MESSPNLLSERIPTEGAGFTRMKSQLLVVCRSRTRFRTTRTTPGQSSTPQFDWSPMAQESRRGFVSITHGISEGLSRRGGQRKCELTGEPRRLPVREHGGEPGEAVPVAVEDGVLGRRLAAKRAAMSRNPQESSRSMVSSLTCRGRRQACRGARPGPAPGAARGSSPPCTQCTPAGNGKQLKKLPGIGKLNHRTPAGQAHSHCCKKRGRAEAAAGRSRAGRPWPPRASSPAARR